MDPYLMWAIVLMLLGLALVFMETFLPSGMLGALAAICIVASVGLAFYSGPAQGMALLAVAVIGVPSLMVFAVKYWPNTFIGKKVLITPPTQEEVMPDNPELKTLRAMVGKVGRAKSLMLPSGAVIVEGRVVDAMSEGLAIEAGKPVRVIEVRGMQVVVRPIEEEEAAQAFQSPDDVLSRPIDSLGLKPLDDTAG